MKKNERMRYLRERQKERKEMKNLGDKKESFERNYKEKKKNNE